MLRDIGRRALTRKTSSFVNLIEHGACSSQTSSWNLFIIVLLIAASCAWELLGTHGMLNRSISGIVRLLRMHEIHSLLRSSTSEVVVCWEHMGSATHGTFWHYYLTLRLVL
jgi:hypothetical protein